ncbi:MAG: dihydrolipoamide acetyltransferase family protein [Acidobacteriota bacterium]
MPQPIIMPKLGQMTEESRVVRWLKQEGQAVAKGEALLEIETDKASMEVESFYDGVLLKILVPEGETVPVMQTIGYIGEPGESMTENHGFAQPDSPGSAGSLPAPEETAMIEPEAQVGPPPDAGAATIGNSEPERIKISPRAAGLALARSLDLRVIQGSGPGGRIVERDVIEALEKTKTSTKAPTAAPAPQPGRPLSRMRQIISQRLTSSFTSTPHFYVTVSVDMTSVEKNRSDLKARSKRVSVTDFVVKAAAEALLEFPDCNSWTDGKTVTPHSGVHIGVAVALEDGLVVPVVRDADRLSLSEISSLTRELVEKAKGGRLKPEEMSGSSFTISNMGMLDVENFTAIINPGESAILAVGSARPEPVAVGGRIEIRPMMKMTLSADHRLVDGALAARFLNRLKDRLEHGDEDAR